jgi:hypothetical protein
MKTLALALPAGLFLFAFAACGPEPEGSGPTSSSSSSSGAGGSGAGSSVASSSASTGAGGEAPSCKGEKAPGSGAAVMIDNVSATVLDTDGAPVPNQIAQLCGLDICLGATTGSDGKVSISGGNKSILQPALKVGDGLSYAKMLRPLTAPSSSFAPLVTPKFPPFAEGKPLTPGTSPASNGVTLALAPDAVTEIDILLYDDPSKQTFRAAAIPDSMMDPDVVTNENATLFYALSPIGTLLCPAATLTLPNTAGLPAGAAVEFLVLGLDVAEYWAPYGEWRKVSDGHVRADGATVSTDEGGGVPILSVVAVRLK